MMQIARTSISIAGRRRGFSRVSLSHITFSNGGTRAAIPDLVRIPLGLLLTFHFDFGLAGLWIALSAALASSAIVGSFIEVNWVGCDMEVEKARKRVGVEGSEAKAPGACVKRRRHVCGRDAHSWIEVGRLVSMSLKAGDTIFPISLSASSLGFPYEFDSMGTFLACIDDPRKQG